MAKKEEYNWLDDPFNPEKEEEDKAELAKVKGCSRSIVIFCVLVLVLLVAAVFFVTIISPLLLKAMG